MASQGPKYPGTVTTQAVSPENANDWVSPGNIAADDDVLASITAATFDNPDISYRLKAQNLGFTIPVGSTIDGILVEIERKCDAGEEGKDYRVQLLDAAGTLVGDNKADTVNNWPTVLTIKNYGGAADAWAASPTPEMINDADFGVVLSAQAVVANADIYVDFIRVTVYYTVPNRRAEVSWAEFEIPDPARRGEVSWAELEVPTAPRRAEVSWGRDGGSLSAKAWGS